MQLIGGLQSLEKPLSASVVTIGNFDGLHRGHRQLIRQLVEKAAEERAPSIVVTFDPHPLQVLHPERQQKPLFSRADLVEQAEGMGVEVLVIEPFTANFARLSPEQFVEQFLVRWLNPRQVLVGHDFAFGADRAGSLAEMTKLGQKFHFSVAKLQPVTWQGQVASSSAIRQALREGRVAVATELLGRYFYLSGEVVHGDGRGASIGVPTANLATEDVLIPKSGVYISRVRFGRQSWPSVTNVGAAPTFHGPGQLRVETHILDQKMDLYGSVIEVEFISYLREEKKFPGVAELKAQILADMAKAREFFANTP